MGSAQRQFKLQLHRSQRQLSGCLFGVERRSCDNGHQSICYAVLRRLERPYRLERNQTGAQRQRQSRGCAVGKNLADKEYASSHLVTIAQAQQYVTFWGEPRTFGLDVVYKYE